MANATRTVRPASKTTGQSTVARKSAAATKPAPARKASVPAKKASVTASKAPTAAKPAAALVPPQAVPAVKPALAENPKADKPKKPKLVRDSFTIPKAEYAAVDALKQRAGKLGQAPKKSELLRAGLMQLSALSDAALLAALAQVPAIKTGRPKA